MDKLPPETRQNAGNSTSPRGNALKRSPGIIRKSRVSYPGPGFLSSATWPSLPKKHYNGLNKLNKQLHQSYMPIV